MEKQHTKKLSNVIKINESKINDRLGELVRETVEETLNGTLTSKRHLKPLLLQ